MWLFLAFGVLMSLITVRPLYPLLPTRPARERLMWFVFRPYVFVSLYPL
jgi:hypothetical protein